MHTGHSTVLQQLDSISSLQCMSVESWLWAFDLCECFFSRRRQDWHKTLQIGTSTTGLFAQDTVVLADTEQDCQLKASESVTHSRVKESSSTVMGQNRVFSGNDWRWIIQLRSCRFVVPSDVLIVTFFVSGNWQVRSCEEMCVRVWSRIGHKVWHSTSVSRDQRSRRDGATWQRSEKKMKQWEGHG